MSLFLASLFLAGAGCTDPLPVATSELVEPTNDTGGGGSDCSEAPYADVIVGTPAELTAALGHDGLVALLPGDYGVLDLTGIDARITGICRDKTRFDEVIGAGELRRMVIERYTLSEGTGTLSDVVLGTVVSAAELRIDTGTVVDLTIDGGVALLSSTSVSGVVTVGSGQAAFVSGTLAGEVMIGEATVLLRSVTLSGPMESAGTLGVTGGTLTGSLLSRGDTLLDGTLVSGGSIRVEGGSFDAEDLSIAEGTLDVAGGLASVSRSTVSGRIVVTGGSFVGDDLALEGTPYALGVAADAVCEDCDFAGEVGAVVTAGSLTLTDPSFDVAGIGVWSRDAAVTIGGGEVISGAIAGVWTEGGALSVEGTGFEEGNCLVVRDATELRADATFDRCAVGVLFDAATGDLTGSTFVANPVDVWRQRCDGVAEPTGVGEANVVDCVGTIELPDVEWGVPP